ncbi:dihydrofolate reductase [Halorarius litoreus]|uniref:dihydrofolate reductase n=1 Tax=Halorarius litoreus TaxID=2962676 RepID=UPI0020CCEC24|nr:dihydrofolate reductase [Halorarius litoreus]
MSPTITLVAAVAENGVIGSEGEMPWYYPEDMKHFKETTMGHPVVMGRTTYESIVARLGEPLPGRLNVVLSSQDLDLPEGAVHAASIEEALALAAEEDDEVFVVGGATVYEQLLDRADRLVLTEIHESHEGDTHFPEWDREAWVELERDDREALSFVTYKRR